MINNRRGMENYRTIFEQLIAHVEHEVIEFKTAENQFDTNKLGKYLSALSNEANLRDVDFAWILMGVNNNRQVVGTQFLMDDTKRQLLKHDIAANTTGGLTFREIAPVEIVNLWTWPPLDVPWSKGFVSLLVIQITSPATDIW